MKTLKIAVIASLISASSGLFAQATWTGAEFNGTGDPTFSTGTNWSAGSAPAANTAIIFSATSLMGLDNNYTTPSFTVNSGVTADVTNAGSEALTIGGATGLTMNGVAVNFALPVIGSVTSTYSINSGSVNFQNAFDISGAGATITINMAAGTSVSFASTPAWFGAGINFTGAGVTASSITAAANISTNISKIKVNGVAAQLTGGKIVTTAVPEPSTWATLAGASGLVFAVYRRRRSVAVQA